MTSIRNSSRRLNYPKGSTKPIRKVSVVGIFVMVAMMDLAPMPMISQNTLFGAQTFVSGLSSTSHRGQRASLFHDSRTSSQIVERKNRNKSFLSQSSSTSPEAISTDAHEKRTTNGLLVRLLTGEKKSPQLQKPKWLEKSSKLSALPTWLFHLRPSVQMMVTIFLYLFHTTVLTQNSIVLPIQLFPNDRGNFQSIGLDT